MYMEKQIVVGLISGLHARPAALLVQEVKRFSSEISIETGTQTVNARSIMGLMSLALSKGSEVTVYAEGEDAEEALRVLENFLTSEEPSVT